MAAVQPLSPLDWLMPRSYIRQLLFFRAAPAILADRLEAGLAGAVAAMPHLAGAVVDHADPPGSVALLVGGPPATVALFSRQDLTDTLDYNVLRRAHFPPSALRGGGAHPLFDPDVAALAGGEDGGSPPPVFRARLTRIRGGAVLAVAVHHATTDITGLGTLLGVWAAHCRGDDGGGGFTPSWCDRTPLCVVAPPPSTTPGNDDGQPPPPPHVPELLFFEGENETATPDPVPRRFGPAPNIPFATGLFAFAAPQLQTLRDAIVRAATTATATDAAAPWVSTGDVLTAVLYSAVVDALHGDEDEDDDNDDDVAEISVPVNLRTCGDVSLPAGYLGAAFGRARVRVPVGTLREVVRRFAEDGGCAEEAEEDGEAKSGSERRQKQQAEPSALHRALAPVALAVRRAITGARAAPIAAALAFVAAPETDVAALRRRPARALSVVSWADEGVSALAWDDAGTRCEAVRVPDQRGRAGRNYVVVLPRRPDGALEVLVSLERAALARLAGPGALVARLAAVRWIEDVV